MKAIAHRIKKRAKEIRNNSFSSLSIDVKRILVPMDFSEYSKKALKYAVQFAGSFNASIDLIYVVEPTIYPTDFGFGQFGLSDIEEELQKRGSEQLDRLIKNTIPKNIIIRKIICTGKPFYEINRYAKKRKINLIIIAIHGHSGMENILFGSTAEKVVRKAPCPVLIVRTGKHKFMEW
jgi:nucleotide-binding universal stress UspA family protein